MTTEITDHGTGERGRFVYDPVIGEFIRAPEHYVNPVAAPAVHQDSMEPTMSMTGTNKIYESKSALRREYKELGFVETGKAPDPCHRERYKANRGEIRATVAEQVRKRKWGMVPLDEKQRHDALCGNQEMRKYEAWKRRNWKK